MSFAFFTWNFVRRTDKMFTYITLDLVKVLAHMCKLIDKDFVLASENVVNRVFVVQLQSTTISIHFY